MSDPFTTEATPSKLNVEAQDGISLTKKCAGLFKLLRTWRGVLLLLLVSKGTHHAILTTTNKSNKCEAGKTKKNLSLSALVFIGVAFLLSFVPKEGFEAVKKHENIYLGGMGGIGLILWIAGSFFE